MQILLPRQIAYGRRLPETATFFLTNGRRVSPLRGRLKPQNRKALNLHNEFFS
jgi:hypothetical protein